jgi:hypothetical protein
VGTDWFVIHLDHRGSPRDNRISQGEVHRRQREIMTPAFSAPQIRALLPVFQNSASKVNLSWYGCSLSDSGCY